MEDILNLLKNNKVVKLVAPTGYGKTTKVPQELGLVGYDVLVIVSDKTIADSLNQMNFPRVKYLTSDSYLTSNDLSYDILIIDQLDTGSLDNLLVLAKWKKQATSKLLLTSLLPHSLFPDFQTYTVKRKNIVEVRYTKDYPTFDSSVNDLVDLIYQTFTSTIEGNYLVFVIEGMKDNIISKLRSLKMEIDVVDNYEQPNKSKRRKIVVSDELGKTYLREADFSCIFDCMREKRTENTITGGTREKISYISKRDANIRAVRSSLTGPVIVYRMISLETFETLPDITDEELFRTPYHHLMIDLYRRGINPSEILFNKKDIHFFHSLFLNYRILDISGKLTPKGNLIRKLPFGLRPGLLCLELNNYSGLVLAACLDSYFDSPFLFTQGLDLTKGVFEFQLDSAEHIKKYYNRFRGYSDCETFLYIYIDSLNYSDMKKFSSDNKLSYSYIEDVYSTIEKANKVLKFQEEEIDVEALMRQAGPIISKLYKDRKMILDPSRTIFAQYNDLSGTPYNVDSLSINLIEEICPKEVYSLISSTVSDLQSISFSYVSPE